jgi:Na+-translocating ferredoxin:NAD+ oxidoreductase RnfG subunit
MLKAQHPEMETFLPSAHAKMGLNCASCHMAEETAEDGTTYHSHYLISPLKSETLMATCAACHGSADAAKSLVESTQQKVTARETEVGNRLSSLKDALTEAVTKAEMTEDELNAVRKLHREAQWYFDFCYVENSEGAHNSKLSMNCLATADEKIAQAMAILNGEETEQPEAEPVPAAAGELTAAEQGFGGEVTVRMELNDDGTVRSLAVETPNETAGLGQRASEEAFTGQFTGKRGPFTYGENGIDALAGATVTSEAVLKAVNSLVPAAEATAEAPAGESKPVEAEKPAEAEQPATEAPAEEKNTESEAVSQEGSYGSFMVDKETNFSTITVSVDVKEGKITKCSITSEAKSEGSDFLNDEIRKAWADAIVENQTADTDAITGASLKFSAAAVQEAVAEIFGIIGK